MYGYDRKMLRQQLNEHMLSDVEVVTVKCFQVHEPKVVFVHFVAALEDTDCRNLEWIEME